MGGSAFLTHNPPLPTPRMPLEIYQKILSQTLTLLQEHYSQCASPIEGPGKKDFGDVDILVASPKSPEYDVFPSSSRDTKRTEIQSPMREVAQNLSILLGAEAFIVEKGNPTINFAIPWPESVTLPNTNVNSDQAQQNVEEEEHQTPTQEKKYIQIDIHHLPNPQYFHWELFHSAHGDLWNILGTIIRPFGLTANNIGLYIRIPEIELRDRKKSMILLTSEPGLVLDFLGLDEGRWWNEFGSQEEMFRFAMGCRMFWIKEDNEDGEGEGEVVGDVAVDGRVGKEGGEMSKKKLKHNDRQRMSKRPIFKAWIEEFVPKIREEGCAKVAKVTREEIREEAMEKFGMREVYEQRLRDWKLERNGIELGAILKGAVPGADEVDPPLRAAAIRFLRSVIKDGEEFDGVIPEAAKLDKNGLYDLDRVRAFVESNWRRAGEIGLKRQHYESVDNHRLKEILKAKETGEVENDTQEVKLDT
ncbi:hypothetical protein HYALB_00001067 [Hymenoscyphus albidus]|uniref:Uncharacterized protein n=1 Tax=Hymenoscyphus albidus TaxID=595503 RepID=A0A9N9QCU0_9HELO|nr:hypothetical protein HYALB_00001067 [Hymenoscyphus albidus]